VLDYNFDIAMTDDLYANDPRGWRRREVDGNAVNRMVDGGVQGIEFYCCQYGSSGFVAFKGQSVDSDRREGDSRTWCRRGA